MHRDKLESPSSSNDDSSGSTFSQHSLFAGRSSGPDTDGTEVSRVALAAKPPQLEPLAESPPPSLKGLTFVDEVDRGLDDIETKYASMKEKSSFNPNFTQTLPIRQKNRTQRLVTGSKSLFRGKSQRKSCRDSSDRRSSATLEPRSQPALASIQSPPISPNWVPVQTDEQRTGQPPPLRPLSDNACKISANGPKRRIVSTSLGDQPLHRQGAIYLSATAREEQKLSDDLKRRQAKLENMRNWTLNSSCDEPNTNESCTEGCPLLAPYPEQEAKDETPAQDFEIDVDSGRWDEHLEKIHAEVDAMRQAKPSDAEDSASEDLKIVSVPFDQGSSKSLPLVELNPDKLEDPDYQGSVDDSHSREWREAMEETIHHIQEPTSTFAHIPMASTGSDKLVEQSTRQRAAIAAANSSRLSVNEPLRTPFDSESDHGDLQNKLKHFANAALTLSTSETVASDGVSSQYRSA